MDKVEREYKNLARLVGEYVEETDCDCGGDIVCWGCLLKVNLGHLKHEQEKAEIASNA